MGARKSPYENSLFLLAATAASAAVLSVRVVDPRQDPIPGATVSLIAG